MYGKNPNTQQKRNNHSRQRTDVAQRRKTEKNCSKDSRAAELNYNKKRYNCKNNFLPMFFLYFCTEINPFFCSQLLVLFAA